MGEFWRLDTLSYLGLWLFLSAVAILGRILPLSNPYGGWPAPDFLLALTFAWILRRPSQIPAVAVVAVFLIEDLFLMRPPGLWALAVLVGSEFLRRRSQVVREMNLLLEWGMVAGVMLAMTVANRLALVIVMSPRDPIDLSAAKLAVTIAVYPLVVWVLQGVLRVRKPATGEVDELGRKL
ncbi:rod shape-determining protein MreD [Rhodobacter sp. NTK016B]|uniref:rod shape-determining protein MreD n=1 Tax=Rhodobacter sp. NTK016B TaxID=2759676 RepID=UPI001A8DB4A9|nr:rod shape-determining protein MreD [Rhodobacter sp. NTK016B]MBN8293052.1 rod shape-determining protein MreD [Rhodobacter sp. NTK016B]